ncbi:MAG: SDR family oxidoreductase [Bacteroidota bacterium]|nr:SDR family oxidoreductase [Bacteroidota bacterium]MDP4233715.1 SDR family oxidoreductase [Bacteroidota bacterium]MDP4242354.1 SDR family oxidoreductase [Bacteroidota bacterium]MDP4288693.1 SDR family oxidoreductase [Bacteroidota bacterium]
MESVVIITGGTHGLGRASVRKWLAEGWSVATCARDEADLAMLEAELPSTNLLTQALDVSDANAVRGFIERVLGRWSRVDVLVNNASILGPKEEIKAYPDETWREVVDINLNGAFYFAKAVLRPMLETRSGVIVNVSSGAGVKGKATWGAYAASKFALEGFTQVLREEVRDRGIRVHAFDPGAMQTDMRRAAYPDEDITQHPTPEAISRILFDIAAVYEPQLGRLTAGEYL